MAISQLSLTDFRNLKSTTIDFDHQVNLISGDNGSGKSSLLEAIHVLCQARSFRTHHLKQCVKHGKKELLLFGRFDDYKAGVGRNNGRLEIRIDGEAIKRRSDLVSKTPINIINPDSFRLIEGPPQFRRSYLDWCLFHVEPLFVENWQLFQHALRQRNRLLKSKSDLSLLKYWDEHICEPSAIITQLRMDCCKSLKEALNNNIAPVLAGLEIDIDYQQGWSAGIELEEALIAGRDRDIRAGFTGVGVHRSDIRLTTNGLNVSQVLSRGQGKRLCVGLLLAVLMQVKKGSDRGIILLVDDLNSELDQASQALVYEQLSDMGLQLFISNIVTDLPASLKGKEFKKFHVEHGIIKPRNFS